MSSSPDDDTAIANGAGADATAGSFTGAAGNNTQSNDTAIADSSNGGTADSTANGKGNTAITVALGPTAVAAASPTSVYTSAGTGSVAVALDSSGGFSLSVDGLTF